jgi:hypothetical protein
LGENFDVGWSADIGSAIGTFFTTSPNRTQNAGLSPRWAAAARVLNRGREATSLHQDRSDMSMIEESGGPVGVIAGANIPEGTPQGTIPVPRERDQGQYVAMRARATQIPNFPVGLENMLTAAGRYLELNPDIVEALMNDNIENLDPGLVRALELLGMYEYGQAVAQEPEGGLYGGGYGYGDWGYTPRRSIASYSPGGGYAAYMGLTNWRI